MENVEKIFSPQTLSWAISRTKLGEKDLEKKIKVKEGTIGKWKSGEVAPSISQAKRLAERAFIAFPMLLLDTPQQTPYKSRTLERLKGSVWWKQVPI